MVMARRETLLRMVTVRRPSVRMVTVRRPTVVRMVTVRATVAHRAQQELGELVLLCGHLGWGLCRKHALYGHAQEQT